MRTALSLENRHAENSVAVAILRHFLDGSSYDDLVDLLDLYDGAAIEFSVCDRPVGDLDHRNTIFWEVRHY
jgi:hypothetical protein